MNRGLIVALVASVVVVSGFAGGVKAAVPGKYANCKALNAKYPHGVGRVGARDKTSGVPVTTFKRSNRLYELNKARDRDKDKIACEKR